MLKANPGNLKPALDCQSKSRHHDPTHNVKANHSPHTNPAYIINVHVNRADVSVAARRGRLVQRTNPALGRSLTGSRRPNGPPAGGFSHPLSSANRSDDNQPKCKRISGKACRSKFRYSGNCSVRFQIGHSQLLGFCL